MLKTLFKEALRYVFEAEIEDYLGYCKSHVSGNNSGVSYQMGVSRSAKPLYDNFINLLSTDQVIILIKLLESVEINLDLVSITVSSS
jgi:hypothetical protein